MNNPPASSTLCRFTPTDMTSSQRTELTKLPARCRALLASMLAMLMLAQPLCASAADWAHKKKFTIDTTTSGAEIKEELSQLPVLLRLHSGNFSFAQAKPDGADLRFFAADGKTPLKYQIENYDAANELANVWVTLPKLAANSKADSLVMAWGNESATAAAEAKGAYDAAQIFVYHFGGVGVVKDATDNGNHASASGAQLQAAGPIGAALTFRGSDRVDVPASASLKLQPSSGFTFTAWVKPTGNGAGSLLAMGDRAKGLRIGLAGVTLNVGTPAAAASTATTALQAGIWQHVAVVVAGGKASFYVDGNPAGSAALNVGELSGEAVIGEGFQGELDEVTLAGTARSADYVRALALSQVADSPMLSFADEEGGGESVSYFAILISSVTIDGWIVIGLLAVMAVISFYVMISKALMLRVANRANDAFLDVFKNKSTELLSPGHADIDTVKRDPRSPQSSIYRLYEIGLFEVSKRFEQQSKAGKEHKLTASGLEAIRASLDAAMLRENQKFNSGMVLLTIAISGGPFLGLLGTVVGVMITFAAIAAAGEVNVNSIAPGIAAALVATVAGLGVAIPALFGYNWLASQIKNVSSDTQVFLDEFVTKSAEMHAD